MKTYTIKECYFNLQGEGANTGRAAVFLRFAGCNLWTGLEKDRASAICQFCDTDFVGTDGPGGGKFRGPEALARHVSQFWPDTATSQGAAAPLVVCTGGEPLLQLDPLLIAAFHGQGFEVAVETNGTLPADPAIDWICVSPKAGSTCVQQSGNELKLVYPQDEAHPEQFVHWSFAHFFLQPMDGPDREANTAAAIEYCHRHPQWRLSLQTHKLVGMP